MFSDIQASSVRPLLIRVLHAGVGRARRVARLDVAALPDHLKRDLGFLDGRDAPARDPLRD